MNNVFGKIKIGKIALIYISSVILTFVILKIPFIGNIYLNDKYFGEIILNLIVLARFYFIFCKENISSKSMIISEVKEANYKKIFKLYFLNIGFYIGASLCMFVGEKSLTKAHSSMFILLGITLAPIIEEFIFRGVIMNRLKIKFGTISSIFINSIIFALLHFDLNVVGRLFFGIVSSILYIQTKNIVNCIVLHVLNNGSIFIFTIISKYSDFSVNMDSEFKTSLILIIIFGGFIASIILNILYIKNNLPRNNS